ncbi:putative cell division cycle 45 (CDC45) [Leptomonas seymouri]|uniref:Putative cell division cycle 45 (CDC45) n=1 Tax=Leptomonas seymouri TaxID=5684 RepID=A0A0N1I5R4_LEPSE|nr:putative cell division cycle 45 (CDC45) [Leptomonas seymouri]|eukprot:KPI88134.1 putative cell division cycle 45 (CDC45) [Leptomonas seymouri]
MGERTGAPEPWERISTYYFSTRKAINILVAPTADAAAASLSLTYLLKVFLYPFKLHPAGSYDEVRRFIEQTNFAQDSERDGESHPVVDDLFILVGLGAPVVLEDYFDFSRHIVIVVDAYRPFHLDNLRRADDERLIVWGSERIQEEVDTFFRTQRAAEAQRRRRRRRRHAMKAARESPRHHRRPRRDLGCTASGTGSGDEGEAGSNDGAYSDLGNNENGEYEEESEVSDSSSATTNSEDEDDEAELFDGEDDDATPSQSQDRIDWRAGDGEVPPHLEALYYACACAGRSSAVEVYELSVILHRFNDAILWHAAIGVCDLYLRRLIDYGTYLVELAPLQEAVSLQHSVRRGVLRDRTEEGVNQARSAAVSSMQLNNRDEEQLYLLRHSSLWDAIWYDPQVASALDLHHVEDGSPRLSQLLASRCGVSMAMARRPWREVLADVGNEALRRVLTELQHCVNARDSAIVYRSRIRCISRKVGYSTEVSAFDVCKLFTAVLAAAPPASVYMVERPIHNSTGHLSAEDVAAIAQRQLVEFQRRQFWRAHALLDVDPNEKPFHEALAEAFSLQQAVADATSAMMQPGSVQSTTGLHYALPTDTSKTSPAMESFCTMRRLSVLAERLFFTLTMSRRRGRQALTTLRPLVLSCALPQPRLLLPPNANSGSVAVGSVGIASVSGRGGVSAASASGSGASLDFAVTATNAAGANGAVMDVVAQVEDKEEYAVVLTFAGSTSAGMSPLPPVFHFQRCMQDEHFSTPPRSVYVERNAVQVQGRESTTYLVERMLLLSVKETISHHQFRRKSSVVSEEDDEGEASGEDGGAADSSVEVID